VESPAPAPSAPSAAELPTPELLPECEALLQLLSAARAGELASVLASPWLQPLAEVLPAGTAPVGIGEDNSALPRLRERLSSASAAFIASAPPGGAAARGLGVLALAVASLQLYARANWTGPPPPAPDEEGGAADCGLPFGSAAVAADEAVGGKELLEELEVDGEPVYELVCGVGYLWLAAVLLGVMPTSSGAGGAVAARSWSLAVWRGRCAFAWQLSLAEASERGMGQSPWLFKLALCDLARAPEGSTLLAGLLAGEALSALQATTEPVLHTWRNTRGRLAAAPGAPTVISSVDSTGKPMALAAVAPTEESDSDAVALRAALSLAPPALRAALLVEVAVRLCWYGRVKSFEDVQRAACGEASFAFKITGVLGIKRQYQTEEFAQLGVKASSKANAAAGASPSGPMGSHAEEDGAAISNVPENLKLTSVDDLTDVLEVPKLSNSIDSDEKALFESPLGIVEQLILLAKCSYLWVTSNPNDEMLLQQVNALAQRVLRTEEQPTDAGEEDGPLLTANWLSFSCGLYYRCRAEHHRNKTRERAAFQLQALVDQFNDRRPSAAHRLVAVHGAGYPARFHLQREMGTRMMRMGMVSTAHEQFKKLRMWPEAIDCLMVAERNVEALDMVNELLEKSPTPRLWCCLGDLEKEPRHYEKAWELSKGRFARAQRSLGRHYFYKEDLAKAVDAFSLALDINPLHSDVWFTMGVAQMRLERFEDAATTFSRCIGVNDENGEAWANLAATHSALGRLHEARNCMVEATRRCREMWKMWESFLGICMQLRDIQGCIQGMRRLVDLDQAARLRERVLGMLTVAVISDQDGLYDNRTGRAFAGQLDDFFKYLTSKRASEPCHWRFWAELQAARGDLALSLESRLRQSRAAKAKTLEERHPEAFAAQLQDLHDCLQMVERTLADPALEAQAKQQLQPFALSVRDVAQQLQDKLDSCVQEPAWVPTQRAIAELASRLEAQAASASS